MASIVLGEVNLITLASWLKFSMLIFYKYVEQREVKNLAKYYDCSFLTYFFPHVYLFFKNYSISFCLNKKCFMNKAVEIK